MNSLVIHNSIIETIGTIADKENLSTYVVGGFVRDFIMKKKTNDIDILVVGDGIEFAKKVALHFNKKNLVIYEKFQTAILQLDECKVEFVGSRKEKYNKDSRNPVVESGSVEDDISRRDFTVNSIAISINKNSFGQVLDIFNGINDIENKILKTPINPQITFDDDPLRMLRAIRFAGQLNFEIEEKTFLAICEMKDRIKIVSQERITEEFFKILKTQKPSIGLKLLLMTNILDIIFPELYQLIGQEEKNSFNHKDVFFHTLKVVDNVAEKSENIWLRFAALMHDIAKPRTKAFDEKIGWTFYGHEEVGARIQKYIFKKLRLPNEALHYVEKLVRLHLRPMTLVKETVTDSAIRRLLFESGNDIDDLMILCRADITSQNPEKINQYMSNYDIVLKRIQEVEERDKLRAWRPPLMGNEIMSICNISQGKLVGVLKKQIEDAILDGRIKNTHDGALNFLLEIKDEILSTYQEMKLLNN